MNYFFVGMEVSHRLLLFIIQTAIGSNICLNKLSQKLTKYDSKKLSKDSKIELIDLKTTFNHFIWSKSNKPMN